MKLHILQEAEEELTEAIQYYDDITPGLGIRLKFAGVIAQNIACIRAGIEYDTVCASCY